MFGIGFGELVVIAIVAVVFVGPQRLPEVARQFAKYFVQFKRIANEVTNTFSDVVREAEEELRREEREAMKKILIAEAKAIENKLPAGATTTNPESAGQSKETPLQTPPSPTIPEHAETTNNPLMRVET